MNIAFPALLIGLLVLPGLFFTLAFYNADNKPLNYIPLTHKAALSLLVTFALHLIGLLVLAYIGHQINMASFFLILSGDHNQVSSKILQSITNTEAIYMVSYLVITYVFAFLIGKLSRCFIKKYKLDQTIKILRINSPWHYLFIGYDWDDGKPDGVMISACVEIGGQGYLYQGFLDSFFLTEEGNIERLVLTDAERRKIEHDKSTPDDAPTSCRFYPIDGHYFILKYSEIKNLNVQFIRVHLKQ